MSATIRNISIATIATHLETGGLECKCCYYSFPLHCNIISVQIMSIQSLSITSHAMLIPSLQFSPVQLTLISTGCRSIPLNFHLCSHYETILYVSTRLPLTWWGWTAVNLSTYEAALEKGKPVFTTWSRMWYLLFQPIKPSSPLPCSRNKVLAFHKEEQWVVAGQIGHFRLCRRQASAIPLWRSHSAEDTKGWPQIRRAG